MCDSGPPLISGIFSLLVVFLGAYILTNVILVVIISNYSATKVAANNGTT